MMDLGKKGRLLAVQSLYALHDMSEKAVEEVVSQIYQFTSEVTTDNVDETVLLPAVVDIVSRASTMMYELDVLMQKHLAKNWSVGRLPRVVAAILRLCIIELQNPQNSATKGKVINSYLTVARALQHSGDVGFINAILDSIAKSIEA
jgi:transcription termination factor NusB